MKKLYIVVLFTLLGMTSFAQQEPQVSHNMFNQLLINPGFAGSSGMNCATAIYRNQWTGFGGEPKTGIFSLDSYWSRFQLGMGISFLTDNLGFEKNIGVKIDLARQQAFSFGTLGFGLQLGLLNKSIDFSKFIYIDQGDPLLTSTQVEKNMFVDLALGFFLAGKDGKYYAGLSSSQLMETKGDYGITQATPSLKRHYYITGGYTFSPDPAIDIKPSALIKTDATSLQFDVNALAVFNKRFWGGLSYRLQDAVVVLIGAYPFDTNPWLKPLKFGYSYDVTTSDIGKSKRSSGSHEVMLGYCIKVTSEPEKGSYKNTRFL
ncbi:MAG: type IX secretion system membrane protein PorP/SprF [Bacteroidota bacterium]